MGKRYTEEEAKELGARIARGVEKRIRENQER